ncbi:hypothetical protein MBLNU230_g6861t1 [Neophaeotheca triangularis]
MSPPQSGDGCSSCRPNSFNGALTPSSSRQVTVRPKPTRPGEKPSPAPVTPDTSPKVVTVKVDPNNPTTINVPATAGSTITLSVEVKPEQPAVAQKPARQLPPYHRHVGTGIQAPTIRRQIPGRTGPLAPGSNPPPQRRIPGRTGPLAPGSNPSPQRRIQGIPPPSR